VIVAWCHSQWPGPRAGVPGGRLTQTRIRGIIRRTVTASGSARRQLSRVTSRGDSDGRSAQGRVRVRVCRAYSDSDSQAASLRADSEHCPGPYPAAQPGLGAPAMSLYRGGGALTICCQAVRHCHGASPKFDSA
jgi:hypothetical protein